MSVHAHTIPMTGDGTGEPEGHAERMIAKSEGREAPAEVTPEAAPATAPEVTPEVTPETPAAPETPETPEVTPEVEESLLNKYSAEYAEKGELSDEAYTAIAEKYGVSREDVDSYISARSAAAEALTEAGYAVVGGEEQFTEMAKWASNNLDAAERDAFNNTVNGGSPKAALEAVRNLHAKYTEAMGKDPEELVDGDITASGAQPFRSPREMTDAMRDPRYKTDAAYRAQIDARLLATK